MPFDTTGFVETTPARKLSARKQRQLQVLKDMGRLLSSADHWCKRHYRRGNDTFCLIGALNFATQTDDIRIALTRKLANATGRPRGRSAEERVVMFNDDPCTSHDQVLGLIEWARLSIERGSDAV